MEEPGGDEAWENMTQEQRMEVDPYGEALSRCKIAIRSALENEGKMSTGEHQILIAIQDIIDAA